MKTSFKRLVVASALAGIAAPAMATNGYLSHSYGTKSKGMGGATVALPQDSMAAAINPAGMVWVGDKMDLGLGLFNPQREYTVEGNPSGAPGSFGLAPGNVESDSEWFWIPHIGRNWMLDADSSAGISVYGNGGMNTDYPDNVAGSGVGTFGADGAGVDLSQLFFNLSYAQKINPTSSWGVSAIIAYQWFEATGLAAFSGFSSDPNNLTNNGHDDAWGYGAKLGWQGEVFPALTLAASYQSRIFMEEFDDYAGLFAEQGDFDIPATATIGLAYAVTPTSKLAFDIQHIWYSEIDSISNRLLPSLGECMAAGQNCLGTDNGSGFGWEDMTVYKLGYQWQTSPEWTWRAGYSYGKQPIPESEVLFNILAPGVVEQHFTFGFTNQIDDKNEWSFAAMYAPSKSVKGTNPLDPGQTIELEMQQYEIEASYSWKF